MKPDRIRLLRMLTSLPLTDTLLATDFDGTLAPIVSDPAKATALPEALSALEMLAERGLNVAVLSARANSFLRAKVPIPKVRLLGDYGNRNSWPEERRALRVFNSRARTTIAMRAGIQLEIKPGSSSVHFRAAPDAADELFHRLGDLASELGLIATRGRMVIEVRPARASKALALESLIREQRPAGVVFAGDDEADREVFEVMARSRFRHVAIGVRSDEVLPGLFDHCDLVVDGPPDLAAFLSAWLDLIQHGEE
ncbi:MAG: trehalose-phosphatase [Candidatus Dormibacteraeota bacterium]|nr:trehalose-phosphatase [Candidatus Dormibacteraeota bacterium]